MKESVKIDKSVVAKARRHVKKTKQTIGGFFEWSAGLALSDEIEVAKWQDKAYKWDALEKKIAKFFSEDKNEEKDDDGLIGIGEIAAAAFGYL